jgi:hypothetical protein
MLFSSTGLEVADTRKRCLPRCHENQTQGEVRANNFETPYSLPRGVTNYIPSDRDRQYFERGDMFSKIKGIPVRSWEHAVCVGSKKNSRIQQRQKTRRRNEKENCGKFSNLEAVLAKPKGMVSPRVKDVVTPCSSVSPDISVRSGTMHDYQSLGRSHTNGFS